MVLASDIIDDLRRKKWKLATAESCTGGSVASAITSVPGASDVFQGALVAYQNHLKTKFLNVCEKDIQQYDVVSEPVVRQMVAGACRCFDVDVAIATTGYAGPSGGATEIPVGTIWIACGTPDRIITKCLHLQNNRQQNILNTTKEALLLLHQFLLNLQ